MAERSIWSCFCAAVSLQLVSRGPSFASVDPSNGHTTGMENA
jgi:hypothetical protein